MIPTALLQRVRLIRALLLVAVSLVCAAVVVDWTRVPTETLVAGDIAPRTIKAPVSFTFQDMVAYEVARKSAEERELPVFVYQTDARDDTLINVQLAFANARALVASASRTPEAIDPKQLERTLVEQFNRDLRVSLVPEDISALASVKFTRPYEGKVVGLLNDALGEMVVADRRDLPGKTGIRVIQIGERSGERVVNDLQSIRTAEETRQRITLEALNAPDAGPANKATAAIARALVRANLTFSPLQTEERKKQAVRDVVLQAERVKRGTVLFREGDTLSERQILQYTALQAQQGEQTIALEWASLAAFLMMFIGIAFTFGHSQLDRFDSRLRNVVSASGLLVATTFGARAIVAVSEGIAALVGFDAEPQSVWYALPFAGAVMLVRLLMGVSWAMLFSVVASVTAGLTMDLDLIPVAFFVVSGFAAAASVSQTRERIAVLKAGTQVALVNAVTVLVIHFVQLYVVDGTITMATTMRPVWSMLFALIGGMLSAFVVLGLTPMFEAAGFVTDYRLMELANLNHPLMRQLMLRAPGSYHHSVVVGSLAEAAAEAIGANALQAKVASYFHDIGKSVKPQYFVENQGKGGNRHNALDPKASAQIIIEHVVEGGRMAAEHGLPKPIQDNIWMHHGTGILQFFYAKAKADNPDVDAEIFRYPGPKPNTREAGIIMLADKVEAATRTIRAPNEDKIRAMISRIVSSVMADGQFSECPLTFQEIHTIADTFVTVLLGIHHQRIEYPQTAEISGGAPAREPVPRAGLITLELHPDKPAEATAPKTPVAQGLQKRSLPGTPPPALIRRRLPGEGDELPPPTTAAPDGKLGEPDYEAVEHLPGGKD